MKEATTYPWTTKLTPNIHHTVAGALPQPSPDGIAAGDGLGLAREGEKCSQEREEKEIE
jgi:hypothetical protein